MAKMKIDSVLAFIEENKNNGAVLREVRDACKKYIKEDREAKNEAYKRNRAESLEEWKRAQDAKPMAIETFVAASGNEYVVIVNSYRFREEIKSTFPQARVNNYPKGWRLPKAMAKEVKDFVKKHNK